MTQDKKLICWKIKKCGRETGGLRVHDLGICPVSLEKNANGTGRDIHFPMCWIIAGTMCKKEVQGTFV